MATGSLGLGCSAEGDGTDLLYQAQGVVAAPSLHELAAFYSVYAEAYRTLAGRLGGTWNFGERRQGEVRRKPFPHTY